MQSRGELEVELGIIFRQTIFAIGLLAHLHVGNRITTFFDVGDFGGGVFRGVVKHGDGNHGGQAAGNAAGVEKIEANLVGTIIDDGRGVPGIDGRAERIGLRTIGGVMNDIVKVAVGQRAGVELANGVTDAVAFVGRTVGVAGV